MKIEFAPIYLILNDINFGVKRPSWPYDFISTFLTDWGNTPIHDAASKSHSGNCAAAVGSPHAAPFLSHAALRFSLVGLQWLWIKG